MTNIRDFTPGTQEQRGAITAHRYPDPDPGAPLNCDHDGFWRFSITVADADEVWIRLHGDAVRNYGEDDRILSVVATELLQMAGASHPDGVLSDGRALSELKPGDLYRGTP